MGNDSAQRDFLHNFALTSAVHGRDSGVLNIKSEETEQDGDDERGMGGDTESKENEDDGEREDDEMPTLAPIKMCETVYKDPLSGSSKDELNDKTKRDSGLGDVFLDPNRKCRSILELLQANTPVMDIAKEVGCSEEVVCMVQKSIGEGNASKATLKRQEISVLLDANVGTADISRITGCSANIIYRVKKLKKKGQDLTPKCDKKRGRKTVITEDLKQFIKAMWQPSMSIKTLAKHTNVSSWTIMRAIQGDTPLNADKSKKLNKTKVNVEGKQELAQIDENQQPKDRAKKNQPALENSSQQGEKVQRRKKLGHSRSGKFPCDSCDKVVSTRESLKDHKRTHSGEKPFACPYCKYCGSSSSLLAHHKKQKHKEEWVQEQREKEKKMNDLMERFLHKSVNEEPGAGEGDKDENAAKEDKRD